MNQNQFVHVGGWQEVTPNEVVMLQASVNYTILYFLNGKKSIVATPLKHLEVRFKAYNFFRTHKSFLINLNCVKIFRECDGTVQLSNNNEVGVSRRKRSEFKKILASLYFKGTAINAHK